MAEGPYVKLYFGALERDYHDVWASAVDLGTYVRMLSLADALWPLRPEIPKSAGKASVRRLVDIGLIVPVLPYHYLVRGLDADRNARSNAARNASAVRWGMPSRVRADTKQNLRRAQEEPPKKNGVVLDERELSEEEQRERYIVGMNKRLGIER